MNKMKSKDHPLHWKRKGNECFHPKMLLSSVNGRVKDLNEISTGKLGESKGLELNVSVYLYETISHY